MNKTSILIVFILLSLVPLVTISQVSIEWQKSLGGSASECGYSVEQTTDNGYIIAGNSQSSNGDLTNNFGSDDIWVIKLGKKGEIKWQKSYGGSKMEWPTQITQTKDGGYILVGTSGSKDNGFKNKGEFDAVAIKLTNKGDIKWQKNLGGSGSDAAYSVQETKDKGYIMAGRTKSSDGDVTNNYGDFDAWLVKLSTTGDIIWQKSFGGKKHDVAYSVKQTKDSGFIMAGYSNSYDGDLTENKGNKDYWIIKTTKSGKLEWQKSFGGNSGDYAASVQQTIDGGYILAGYSESYSLDLKDSKPGMNMWVIKLSKTGKEIWQRCLGGIGDDAAYSVQQTKDRGYVLAGYTIAPPSYVDTTHYNVTGFHGGWDFWVVKLSEQGDLVWQKCLGGKGDEMAFSIQQTNDGGYIVLGNSSSTDGDATSNHGNDDLWIVKLKE